MSSIEKNEKRETLADIVAEIRRDIKLGNNYYAANLPDRIEAACKREKAEWEAAACACVSDAVMSGKVAVEHVPVGNAAAMRDALESVRNWCINKLGGASFQVAVEGLLQIVDKAMTAPARNCDRFADETDAQIAFLNEVWLISVTKETALEQDRFENWTDEMRSSYAKWLFATAERKGEGDGR